MAPVWALSALAALFVSSCDDPSCVFGATCFQAANAQGSLGATALFPVDGELVLAAAPAIVSVLPDGTGGDRHPDTPVALVFNETMSASTALSAFEIVDTATDVAVAATTNLLSDGRLLVLRPDIPLPQGTYALRFAVGAEPLDVTGQALTAATGDLTVFTVADAAAAPAVPSVVLLFPPTAATNQSSTTEIVCVFDREVLPPIDLATGWDVVVRASGAMVDAPPAFDPVPTPITDSSGIFGMQIPDNRVWTWRSLGPNGPARLEASGGQVTVTVSPALAPFTDMADPTQVVAQVASTFTLSLAPRVLAGLLNPGKQPQDSIGIANIDGVVGAESLELQVEFEMDDQALDGDILTVFFFGTDPQSATNTIGFSRSITLAGAMPIQTATVSLTELDFTSATAPLAARVADGTVRFAMRLERTGEEGYATILDVDLAAAGVQDPLLDTVRPTITLLDGQVDLADDYRTDVLDIAVAGHADVGFGDFVRGALVSTVMFGDNVPMSGGIPPVLGSSASIVDPGTGPIASSMFLTTPIFVGRLPTASPTIDFTLTVFDRAFNASETSVTVPYRQLGAVGETALDPAVGTPMTVEVYDAETLLPIQGATVYSHAEMDDGFGGLIYPQIAGSPTLTGADGISNIVPHHNVVQLQTLITVVAGGYDTVTFQNVPITSLSIPMTPSQQVLVMESNSVLANPGVDITSLVRRVGDTRRSELAFPTTNTLNFPGTTEFDFDVAELRPFRFGIQSFLAGILDADIANVSKDRLIKAFELRIPVAGQSTPFLLGDAALTVDILLDDAAGPVDDAAQAVTPVGLDASGIVGLDPANLESDFHYGAEPLVEVETTLPGIDRPIAVGLGAAYDTVTADVWDIESAFAGLADPGHPATPFGSELRLRAELREDDPLSSSPLAVSGIRPDLADLAALDPLVPPNIPAVTSIPTDGTGSIGVSVLDLTFTDVVDDASGLSLDGRGLHRVTLTEDLGGVPGRKWVLYRLDPVGTPTVTVHFPDLAPDPRPLLNGPGSTTTIEISVFAWETFPLFDPMDAEPDLLLWSDLAREAEIYAHSPKVSFTLL